MLMTLLLTLRLADFCCVSSSAHCFLIWGKLTPWKSYREPALPKSLISSFASLVAGHELPVCMALYSLLLVPDPRELIL